MADNYEINVTLDEVFGTGIRSVDQTVTSDEPGGQNEITVTLTNGETNTFYVKNGPEGRAGTDGKDGTSSGYPVPVTLVSEMTDPHIMYLYGGNEEGYRANHIYHLEDGELVDYGEYGAPADYVQNARRDQRYGYDQGGTVVYEDRLVYFDTIKNGEPQTVQFSERLYRETGNNEDGALTQKATTEAIESSMSLPVVTYGEAAEYDPTVMEVTIDPNTLYVLNGIGTAFTSVEIIRNVAIEKEDRLNRYMVRFVTGGSLANLSFTNATPALLSLKTETTYDIEIINGIVHVWEDGQAIGNVLDTTATANAVTAWLNNHPEATTTVADGSITTAKLASSVIDNTLSTPGSAADAKKTGDEISELKSQIAQSTGMSDDFKIALENLLQYVVYKGDDPTGRTYLTALHNAMYPPAQLTSITAVYTQSGTVYNTDSLDDLKADLVVTANYDDGTSETVTTYTLSGTLAEGTSVITVSYGEETTTFNVTVTVRRVSGDDVWYDGVAYEDLTIVANEYVKYNNGTFVAYNGWSRTGFVYCEGASSITFPPIPESGSGNPQSTAFYSDNNTGTRIKAFQLSKTASTTVTVPSNAKYFAISSNTSALNSCIEAGIVPNA